MLVIARIKPNSRHREEVVEDDNGNIIIFSKAPALEGKANEAAIRLLAKHYAVAKSQVRLIRGHTSKQKVFEIDA